MRAMTQLAMSQLPRRKSAAYKRPNSTIALRSGMNGMLDQRTGA